MKIVEIFNSIQGEGTFAGTSALFIRFFGCNLQCNFGNGFVCDDKAHSNKELVKDYSKEELIKIIISQKAHHIVLTGGEPSLWALNGLISKLQKLGYFIQVETNGLALENISNANFITYSPKIAFTNKATEITTGFDELKLLAGVHKPVDLEKWGHLKNKFIQPIGNEHSWDQDNVNYCKQFVLDHPSWSLSLQLHKILEIR